VAAFAGVIVIFLLFVTDTMRLSGTEQQLQFAAESAGMFAYAHAANADGSYSVQSASANMTAALKDVGGYKIWNEYADNNLMKAGGLSMTGNLTIVPNPIDQNERFLEISLQEPFAPLFSPGFLPQFLQQGSTASAPSDLKRQIEIIGQPASRIGPGQKRSLNGGAEIHFAVLPLALSYRQFKQASSPDGSQKLYTIDLGCNSQNNKTKDRWRGCFVNVTKYSDGVNYYGDADGVIALDQLIGNWKYFQKSCDANAIAPAMVERGSMLACFNASTALFDQCKPRLIAVLKTVPLNSYYIVPVIADDPSPGKSVAVVGFARLRLITALNQKQDDLSFSFEIGESAPMQNATFANGWAAVPKADGHLLPLPPPSGPFDTRFVLSEQNGISRLPRGVVLAPSLSPRENLAGL
jgi:hypothetical protein